VTLSIILDIVERLEIGLKFEGFEGSKFDFLIRGRICAVL